MLNLPDHNNCIGCGNCQSVCPTKCISLKEDKEGFQQIYISMDKCVHCLQCEENCPIIKYQPSKNRQATNIKVYACHHINPEVQTKSSSGGFFTALCETFFSIYPNAIIYGAVLQEDLSVKHDSANNITEIQKFVGSKYLQSDITEALPSIKKNLKNNQYVLFTGTPCQIAALYTYLKKDYQHLFTSEVICHGVPSALHFRKQNEYWLNMYGKEIKNIHFRSKYICWAIPMTKYTFNDNSMRYFRTEENSFMAAFYSSLNLRRSCYVCNYASIPRFGDFTMGDFWKIKSSHFFSFREIVNGISLVLCNNEKADKLFSSICKKLKFESSSLDRAIQGNIHLIKPTKKDLKERELFFHDIQVLPLNSILEKYNHISMRKKLGIILGRRIMYIFYYLKNRRKYDS